MNRRTPDRRTGRALRLVALLASAAATTGCGSETVDGVGAAATTSDASSSSTSAGSTTSSSTASGSTSSGGVGACVLDASNLDACTLQ